MSGTLINKILKQHMRFIKKKYKWISRNKKFDYLIVDESGSDVVKPCIKAKYSYKVLPLRSNVRLLNHAIIIFFIFQIHLVVLKRINLLGSYILAVSRALKSSVIVTLIDNNSWCKGLHDSGYVRIVMIQNGIRGANELDLLPPYDVLFGYPRNKPRNYIGNEYYGVGNIKSSMILYKKSQDENIKNQVLFVSQYRSDRAEPIFISSHLVQWVSKYALKRTIPLVIALNSTTPSSSNEEEKMYRKLLKTPFKCTSRVDDYLASYRALINSRIVIGCNSSLLVESLAMGIHTLLCWNQFILHEETYNNNVLYFDREEFNQFSTIANSTYLDFEKKADEIITLSNTIRFEFINKIRSDYCEFSPESDIIKSIQNRLEKLLKN